MQARLFSCLLAGIALCGCARDVDQAAEQACDQMVQIYSKAYVDELGDLGDPVFDPILAAADKYRGAPGQCQVLDGLGDQIAARRGLKRHDEELGDAASRHRSTALLGLLRKVLAALGVIGVIGTIGGGVWLATVLLQEGLSMRYLLIPVVALVFAVVHWNRTWRPLLVTLAFAVVATLGLNVPPPPS